MQARGVAAMMADSFLYVIAADVVSAGVNGILPTALAGYYATLPGTLNAINSFSNPSRTQTAAEISAVGGIAAAAAGAVYPPAGAVVALVTLIAAAVAKYLPYAIGISVDDVGRALTAPGQQTAWEWLDLDPSKAAAGQPPDVVVDPVTVDRSGAPITAIAVDATISTGSLTVSARVSTQGVADAYAKVPRAARITVTNFVPDIPDALAVNNVTAAPPSAAAPGGVVGWITANPYRAAGVAVAGLGALGLLIKLLAGNSPTSTASSA
jgi:hypothetical protein